MKKQNGLFNEPAENSIRETLVRYTAYWPLFLLSLVICMGAGYLYVRYTPAKYMASTSILIKGDQDETSSKDIIDAALNGKRTKNLNNEILLLNSLSLMKAVVSANKFNIDYYKKGKVLDVDIYLNAPFRLNPATLADSLNTTSFTITKLDQSGGSIQPNPAKNGQTLSFSWNKPFNLGKNHFILVPDHLQNEDGGSYVVTWKPVADAAEVLSGKLNARSLDQKASVIELNIVLENLQKAKDVLNAVTTEFNHADIEDRRRLNETTVRFVDERLSNIAGELQGVEGGLESFQGNKQLSDIRTQSTQSIEGSNEAAIRIKELNVQESIVGMLLGYFNNPANNGKLVPTSMGLSDPTLATLIANYNELQLKKEREAPRVAPNSTVMQDITTQLSNLRGSILESLNNISNSLRIQLSSMQQQNSQYLQFLAAVPHNERVLQEIKRKQSITEGLYLYLLQKREEAAISSTASSVAHYRQIDPAAGWGPVEPNKRNILLYTALLGLCLPIGFIYGKNLLNEKVSSKEDIAKKTNLPLLGEINHLSRKSMELNFLQSRSIIGEQFRIIRTNLSFLGGPNKKVILVTSSGVNEGKSFVSYNLASVLAMPGKKVALLEFDLRTPSITKLIQMDSQKGLTHYLSGPIVPLDEIYETIEGIPGLHFYPAGPLPPNPGDLLINEAVPQLFDALIKHYDFIVVDTPPAGLVSDAFILGTYSDLVLCIVRQKITRKKSLDFIKEMAELSKLRNVGLVFNDVKTGGKYGYGGYGYDEKNGYFNAAQTPINFRNRNKKTTS